LLVAPLLLLVSCGGFKPYRVLVANPCPRPVKVWLMYEDALALVGASNTVMDTMRVPPESVSQYEAPIFPTSFGLLVTVEGPPGGNQTASIQLQRTDALDISALALWTAVIPSDACDSDDEGAP
jgi:subtilisin family serine protease